MVEMVTSGYAIAGDLSFPSDSGDFVQTNDIRAIATQFNVSVSPSIPTGNVFYHAGKYRMSTPGIAIVTLTITDFSGSSLFYGWDFQFGSTKNVGCNPIIGIRNCGGPRDFVSVNVKQSVFVEATIQRDCGRDSNIAYSWSISNYFDTKTLQSFNVDSRSLKVPPFSILTNYNREDVFSRLNVIKLVTLERSADGTQSGEAVNRCYIFIVKDDPIAKIAGGERQEYSNTQQILMDASDSADMAVHPRQNQNLIYSWRCSSINDADDYCKNLNEIAQSFTIRPNRLVLARTYNFTLTVTSLNTNSSDSAHQLITVVAETSHQLRIKCIRNCRSQRINSQSIFHLRAICLTCGSASVNFAWEILPPPPHQELTSSRLVIEPKVLRSGESYKFKVSVRDGKGFATVEMTTLESINERCTVSPSEGIESITKFNVTCSKAEPWVFYVLYQGDTQLLVSNIPHFTSTLNANGKVQVKIQNTDGQHIRQELTVNIVESPILHSIEEITDIFTSKNDSINLHRIINEETQGDAIVFINMVADRLSKLNNVTDTVERIIELMKELRIDNFEDIASISQTMLKLLSPIPMNHKLALRCATILDKMSATLKRFDEEMSITGYIDTSRDVLSVINQLIDPFETIPPVQNRNPLISHEYHTEDYEYYGTLDFGIFEKLENLETVTTSVENTLIGMATSAAMSFQPMEMLENITADDIQFETLVFDQEVARNHGNSLKVNGTSASVTVSEKLLSQFDSDSSISCTFFNKNPMWWFSDGGDINSDVVGVSIYRSASDVQENVEEITKLQSPLQISMEIKNKLPPQQNETFDPTNNMRTFKVKCPINGILSLNFTRLSGAASMNIYFTNHPMTSIEISSVSPAMTINETNQEAVRNLYKFECPMASESLVFMSIVSSAPINETSGHVELSFELNSIQCLHWETGSNTWQSDGCLVDLELSSGDRIDCKCSHLSLFAVRHQKSDYCGVSPDSSLFPMKSVVWICLLFLLMSLVTITLWAWRREKLDKNNQKWIYLESEHTAKRPHSYAVTVITGCRQNANTTSHVAIKIHGSEHTSQIIPLFARGVQLFQRGSINNFIITMNKSFGRIRNITLCVDYHGPCPSWYCEAVIIRDRLRNEEWNFDVKHWLPRETGDKAFTVSIVALAEKEYFDRKRLFGLHWADILQSSYSLFGACMWRSDGRLSRVEKVYIAFASIEMGLMANVVFFSYNQDDSRFVLNVSLSVIVGVCTTCAFRILLIYLLLRSSLVKKNRQWRMMFRSESV
ncbi:sperm receptor for egg jelly-like [Bradysia coprophila]|uniref:sperm receptor for egg jelly-like n=1 Tax=Bradysia coprophila TaxID=38358 RepID=UPI00187D7A49|nr:sperm receptor for egg jelly-like [Bradysia coprophila]